MTTRSFSALPLIIFVLMTVTLLPLDSGIAQDKEGRWAFGVHAGGNIWDDDYNKRVIGEGGEFMVRYGISRTFSAGVLVGYEELKSNQDPSLDGFAYLKLHAIPGSLVGWIHFAPEMSFNPYLYAGVGAMLYNRMVGGNFIVAGGQSQTSIHVPLGIGFEALASKNVSIAFEIGYRILDDNTDGRTTGNLNGYAIAKAGVNFYFGTSAGEKEVLAKAEAERIQDTREAEARRVNELADAEAQRIKALADAQAEQSKDSTETEARRQADLSAVHPADTVFVVLMGKTVTLEGIDFDTGKSTLTENSKATLKLAFNALFANPEIKVLIVGHTDKVGNAARNKKLSLRRAQTVRSWLVRKGISVKRLTVRGEGWNDPIDDNTTAEGRANNRRLEFRVLK